MDGGFLGLYRATVIDNLDPEHSARVRVEVPAIFGEGQSTWAMPCVPYLDPELHLATIPPIGTGVRVTFERGDLDYPVWMGRFFSPGEGPGPGP